jgi:hypothetical protein
MKESFMSESAETSNVSRRHFLAVAGSVAAASSFAAGKDGESAEASTVTAVQHIVTIDVKNGSFLYTVNTPNDPKNLRVKLKDDVKWIVKTAGETQKHHAAIFFPTTSPFLDKRKNPTKLLRWTEKDEASGGYGVPGGVQTRGTHKYCVAIFDDAAPELYLDDPKIIVGTGIELLDTADELGRELGEAKEKIEFIKKALREEREKSH